MLDDDGCWMISSSGDVEEISTKFFALLTDFSRRCDSVMAESPLMKGMLERRLRTCAETMEQFSAMRMCIEKADVDKRIKKLAYQHMRHEILSATALVMDWLMEDASEV